MTAASLVCPYCNAYVTTAPGAAAGQRVPCPRCGETFTLRPGPDAGITNRPPPPAGIATAPAASPLTLPAPERGFRSRWSNRKVAGVVLGVMLCMAGAGLAFALLTVKERRAHDTMPPPRPRRWTTAGEPLEPIPPPARVAPARLAGLGYLAPDTSVVAGLHVAELLDSAPGRELLREPIRVGGFEVRLGDVDRWTGLKLEELDHLVLGVRAEDPVPPRINLVARTQRPYDREKVREALKARPVPAPGKTLYRFELTNLPFPLVVWFADDRTLVAGLLASHLEDVPATPGEGLRQLAPELRDVLQNRMGPVGPFWAAGHARDWEETAARALLQRLKPPALRRARSVQTFAVWLNPEQAVEADGVFRCRNEAAARALDEFFAALDTGTSAGLKTARDASWLTVQLRTDLATVRRVLGK